MSDIFGVPLPETWNSTRLKNVASRINRGSAPDYIEDGPVRVIGQAANQDAALDWTRTRFHEFAGDPTTLKGALDPDDILVNSTGTGTLGRVGFFHGPPDQLHCMADSHITILRTDKSAADPRFIYYWLRSQPFYDYIYSALVVGATNQIELSREGLANAPVPIPPLAEQQRIAEFLTAETARIDGLRQMKSRQIDALQEWAYGELSEILIPGVLTRASGIYPWTWLPNLPSDRPLARLGYVCRLQNGITVDGKRVASPESVTLPYLRVANVQAGRLDLSSVTEITVPKDVAARSTLQAGDVLMTEGGDLDKLGRGTVWNGEIPGCLHQNHIFALRPDPVRLDAQYLSLLTQSLHGRCYFESTGIRTTNLASTNSNKILSFPIPLPGTETQRRLVRRARASLNKVNAMTSLLKRQWELLLERRQALITAAVTGELDVSTASGRGVAGYS